MAADVRDSETRSRSSTSCTYTGSESRSDSTTLDLMPKKETPESEEISSSASFSDSRITLNSEISSIPELENDHVSISSDVIVQKQMRDVILSQKAAVQQLVRSNIDALNTSKLSFNRTFEYQEDKIKQLEWAIKNDLVPKDTYLELRRILQDECDKHAQTKGRLSEVCGELAVSHQRISKMKVSLKREREDHESRSNELKDNITELQEENTRLKSLLQEKNAECEEVKGHAVQQTVKIDEQAKKHQEEKVKFKQMATDLEIARQQEAYLHRMMLEKRVRKTKP